MPLIKWCTFRVFSNDKYTQCRLTEYADDMIDNATVCWCKRLLSYISAVWYICLLNATKCNVAAVKSLKKCFISRFPMMFVAMIVIILGYVLWPSRRPRDFLPNHTKNKMHYCFYVYNRIEYIYIHIYINREREERVIYSAKCPPHSTNN